MSQSSATIVSNPSSRPPERHDRTKTIRPARGIRPSWKPAYAAVWNRPSTTWLWRAASWLRPAAWPSTHIRRWTRLRRPASDEWSVQPAAARCLPAPTALRRPTGHANASSRLCRPAAWDGAGLRRWNEPAARAVRRAASSILQCRPAASTAANGSGKPSSGSVTSRAGRGHADEPGASRGTRFEVVSKVGQARGSTRTGRIRDCCMDSGCCNAKQ